MNKWRTYPYYLLLSAFALKILVWGTILTLATHNICLERLLDDEVNWSKLVFKQRKRNDEPSPNTTVFHYSAGILGADDNMSARRILIQPAIFFFNQLSAVYTSRRLSFVNTTLRYIPDKIFIKYCSLIR
ncbi:hypothetical protein F0L74_29835 [Chitinophaga agrisoli]|uniref:Uncharacterized protein n=1 Tax=Chitinophaga agrisoli TaxID=2607653 RepID=A0A5B2VQF7_9BACT|nr:hypothetical protein [Chitinophaga agrisoli]KAA2240359.1 hypothetical protein F0L74_29835 [Chitinophaga agrisoli]